MSLTRRVAHLEGWRAGGRLPPWVRSLAAERAVEAGTDPVAVMRETAAILAEAQRIVVRW